MFVGELICPTYHELCDTGPIAVFGQCPNSCTFNGDCVDGMCHCFPGFHGHDCSKCELFYTILVYACTFICYFLRDSTEDSSVAGSCPDNCNGHGKCLSNGVCECENGYTGIDCSTGTENIVLEKYSFSWLVTFQSWPHVSTYK